MAIKTKYKILLALFVICFLASLILSFVPLEQACGGLQTGCYAVQTSQYETTFGIKNAYLGLVAFAIVGFLAFMQIKHPIKERKQLIGVGVIIASLIAVYLLYVQFFVLHAVCKYCMVIDSATLVSLAIMIFWKEK
jgi:uncharacterized membrane protein